MVLNSDEAVKAFSRGGNVTLGGSISAAAGPIGTGGQVAASMVNPAPIFSYSRSKGESTLSSSISEVCAGERGSRVSRPIRSTGPRTSAKRAWDDVVSGLPERARHTAKGASVGVPVRWMCCGTDGIARCVGWPCSNLSIKRGMWFNTTIQSPGPPSPLWLAASLLAGVVLKHARPRAL